MPEPMAEVLGDLREMVIQLNSLLVQAEIRLANASGPPPVAAERGAALSQRDLEVLRLVARGLPNARIADELVGACRATEIQKTETR